MTSEDRNDLSPRPSSKSDRGFPPQDPHGAHRQWDLVHLPPALCGRPNGKVRDAYVRYACEENGIEHRQTKIKHPWANGQVERMNRTIKEARPSNATIAIDTINWELTLPTSSQPTTTRGG
ncbi:hypothetical protein ACVIW0_001512 [Bradyrhizobium sp. USDA 4454]